MAFFDELGKKISQTGQSAVKKTKDMAEVAKINSMISDEEKSINNNYYQIGKLYTSMHANDCESDFKGMIDSICESEKKIAEYKEQVQLIKGVVKCEKCGGEVSINSAFCNSCGAPMPKRVSVQQQDESMVKCSKCGKYVKKGMRFCTSCGNPMQQSTNVPSVAEVVENQIEKIHRRCPNCGFETDDHETIFCNECGTKMSDVSSNYTYTDISSKSNSISNSVPKVKKCTNCGFETSDNETDFCTECGTKLS